MARMEQQPTLATQSLAGSIIRRLQPTWRELRRNPSMLIGLVVLLVMVSVAIASPFVTRTDAERTSLWERLEAPSAQHWFGTDHLGRDVFDRTLIGSRVSLVVAVSVGGIVSTFGFLVGLIAGYERKLDAVLMRIVDGLMAFPSLLLALAVIALLGASLVNVIGVISLVQSPRIIRIVRGSVLSLREQPFVDAARSIGAPTWRILIRHVAPNTFAPVIVQSTFVFAGAVITEANLSFLGVGVPPNMPTWGNIMGQGRTYLQMAVWVTFYPGLFLSLTVMAINLVGDGLRDTLDPKLRHRM
jgi:peptide/nickel transport system permease protein